MRLHLNKQGNDAAGTSPGGFTIVELMIAMSVLSVLLLISSLTLISIGRLYSKGVNEAATQNTTRNITNNLASQLELAGSNPIINPAGQSVICIGAQRYTYRLGHELTSTATDHVLWHDTMNSTSACNAVNLGSNTPSDGATVVGSGGEMVAVHMRLTDLSVAAGSGSNYNLVVGVAYGDDDLLCDSGSPPDCSTIGISTHLLSHAPGSILCKGGTGSEYCAVSFLATNIGRRLNS